MPNTRLYRYGIQRDCGLYKFGPIGALANTARLNKLNHNFIQKNLRLSPVTFLMGNYACNYCSDASN